MDANKKSSFNLRCKFLGTKLLLTRFKQFNGNKFAFTRWISPANELWRAVDSIRVYKPLWLDLMTAMTGKC